MRPFFASVCKSAVLLLLSLFLLGSRAFAQVEGSATDPSLRTLMNSQPHDSATPNYVVVELSEKKLLHFYPELKGLQPADTQQDLPKILERVGANQNLLLQSIPDIVCHEVVVQSQLDKKGFAKGLPLLTGEYKYLVLAHTTGSGIHLNEVRINSTGKEVDPRAAGGPLLAQGFGLLPLHFHPFHQTAAKFRYLGRQVVDDQNDYVVAFVQQKEKSHLIGLINVDGVAVQVAYQGIAWINPDNFQIVRMRTDLVQPQPNTGSQETEVRLNEFRFETVATPLWLPNKVVVTRTVKGNAVRETHEFSGWKRSILEFKSTPPPEKQK